MVVTMALAVAPALAAFPGRDGELAVVPLHGPGLMMVSANGAHHGVCGACGTVLLARWSPDGQAVALTLKSGGTSLIYGDGSCLDCSAFGGSRSAFTATPSLISTISGGNVTDYGTDGLRKQTVVTGHVTDAVWSAAGELAVVRSGRVLAGPPAHLRSLGRGNSPSWAPGGSRLALVRHGRVLVVGVNRRGVRRLAKGSSPAFSPNGKSVAFIGSNHRLSMVSAGGGRVRRVGHVQGGSVDWQPIRSHPPAACTAPPGSMTVATSSIGVITADSAAIPGYAETAPAYMGCLLSTGRERLLARYDFQSIDAASSAGDFVIAGNFAAFSEDDSDPHYGGSSEVVHVFDLVNGTQSNSLGGEQAGCPDYNGYDCNSDADQLVLNADGFTAVHTTVAQLGATGASGGQVTEQILAVDSTGTHVEDTVTQSVSGPLAALASLTDLQLSGDTLTWLHDGSPRSATLQ
jgi:hypothetical protein